MKTNKQQNMDENLQAEYDKSMVRKMRAMFFCKCGKVATKSINIGPNFKTVCNDCFEEHEAKNYKPLKIQCPCGSMIRKDEKKRHEQTMKHLSYIESI